MPIRLRKPQITPYVPADCAFAFQNTCSNPHYLGRSLQAVSSVCLYKVSTEIS